MAKKTEEKPSKLAKFKLPTFEHASHLDPVKWPRIVENGVTLPCWVQKRSQVKSVSDWCTFRTYGIPKIPAPTPAGFSWHNLDLCGGWSHTWQDSKGNKVDEDLVILMRVLTGNKVCGSFQALGEGEVREWRTSPSIVDVRALVAKYPGFTLKESKVTHKNWKEYVWCWVAPDRTLGEAIDLGSIVGWYYRIGYSAYAEELLNARDLYLPKVKNFDVSGTHSYAVTGAILGYPPTSTAGF